MRRKNHTYALTLLPIAHCLLPIFFFLFPVFCDGESDPQKKLVFFDEKVRPIFEANCYFCHSGANPKKDLNLSDLASVMQRDPVVIKPNDADSSLLFHMVSSKKMPPPEFSDPLSPENIEILRQWINDSAVFSNVGAKQIASPSASPSENDILIPKSTDKRAGLDWWSLQKVEAPQGAQHATPLHPAVKDTAWVKNPIDRFVLAKIEAIGAQQAAPLHPAPKADKLTLIRRVTFDLTGLPPTPEEVDAFLNDNSSDAYERLVERLLASAHYGERWARHWLDVVRFGESHGFEVDSPRDNAWRYRDYVISAFNEDKPYDQFIIEQLAGDAFYSDELNTVGAIAATGFLVGWIANPDNPLTSRVMVNRIWQHHFGEGIVRTPSDFGFNGDKLSHPELLDWLATYFVKNGWSLKKLHRLILMSNTYQQSSQFNEKAFQIDADNRLLWRMNRQRLDAESIRDAMLSVSDKLDTTIGGPSFRLSLPRNDNIIVYDLVIDDGPQHWRRSVYRFAPRTGTDPFLDTFDCPDPSVATPKRRTTNTPLQALSLLNNRFILKQAVFFAERLKSTGPFSPFLCRKSEPLLSK